MSTRRRDQGVLYEGDTIYLAIDGDGYVHSDGFVDERLGCLANPTSLLQGCLFRVLPKLSYEAHKALHRASAAVGTERHALMVQQAKIEADANAMLVTRAETASQSIVYGQAVQLQHVLSGKFLTSSSKSLAPLDKSCTKVELHAPGSTKSWFMFIPRYRNRTLGQPVAFTDAVCLTRSKHSALFLHQSRMALDDLDRCEINISYKETVFRVIKYAQHGAVARSLHAGKLYRLYHMEGQSYVSMTANNHKIKKPYLRPIQPDTNPLASDNMTVKSLFTLERMDARQGGCVDDFTHKFRFRHVASGKFLALESMNGATSTAVFNVGLCGTCDEDTTDGSKFVLTPSGGDSQVVYRIETHVHGRVLRLHNPHHAKSKPSTASLSLKQKASGVLEASTNLSDQDVFALVEVSDADSYDTHLLLSTRRYLGHYRRNVQRALETGVRLSHLSLQTPITALRLLDSFLQADASSDETGDDDGTARPPPRARQDKARQLKLIDTLYDMLRVVSSRDLAVAAADPRRRVLHHVHKLINHALVRMAHANLANKHYIATRSAATYYDDVDDKTGTYLDETRGFIGSETGAKCVFRTVYENHAALLVDGVDADLVQSSFATIQAKGVRAAGMLQFLSVVCSCDGTPLPQNQERIVRGLFSLADEMPLTRFHTLIDVCECPQPNVRVTKSMRNMALALPQSMATAGLTWKPLGHVMIDNGQTNLVITWKSCRGWAPGSPALFHTPEELGLPVHEAVVAPANLVAYRQTLPHAALAAESEAASSSLWDVGESIFELFPSGSTTSTGRSLSPTSAKKRAETVQALLQDVLLEESNEIKATGSEFEAFEMTELPSRPVNATTTTTTTGTSDAAPSSTDVDTTTKLNDALPKWVLLEHVTWTLQPYDLYPVFFNKKPWADADVEIQADKRLRLRFDQLKSLAEYFHLQLQLLVELVRGGSASSIIAKQFSYTMLVSSISNDRLPHVIRTSLAVLLHHCYVDRFPHEAVSTDAHRIFVYEEIAELKTHTPLPLPAFEIKPNHPVMARGLATGDEFLLHPYPNKMAVLQATLYLTLCKFAATPIKHLTVASTAFLQSLLLVVHDLFRFGFYSELPAQTRVVSLLLCLLDGRNTGDDDVRYRRSRLHNSITAYKAHICRLLSTVVDMWRDVDVCRVLSFFKFNYLQEKRRSVLKARRRIFRVADVVHLLNDPHLDLLHLSKGTLDFICVDLMLYDDKALVHHALALMIQCNTRRERVLQALVTSLLVYSSPPRAVVGGQKTSPSYQVFKELDALLPLLKFNVMLVESPLMTQEATDLQALDAVVAELESLVRKVAQCCCDYSADGLAVKQGRRKSTFWGMLDTSASTRHYFPKLEKQRIVLHMQVHKPVMALLALPDATPFMSTDAVRKLKNTCCEMLTYLVHHHPEAQHAVFAYMPRLGPFFGRLLLVMTMILTMMMTKMKMTMMMISDSYLLLETLESMGDLLIALLTNNVELCRNVPHQVIWKFVRLLDTHRARLTDAPDVAAASFLVICHVLDFAIVYIAPNDLPSATNQTLWLDIFMHEQFHHTIVPFADGITPEMETLSDALMATRGYQELTRVVQSPPDTFVLNYFQRVLVLLGLVCRGRNMPCEVKCQQTYPLNLVLTILLDAKMPMGLKYVAARYVTQVFLHPDSYMELTSMQSPMWRLLLQSSNTVREFALGAGDRFLYRDEDVQFRDLFTDYIFHGLLGIVAAFFRHVFHPSTMLLHDSVDALVKSLHLALDQVQDHVPMDAFQTKIVQDCRQAVATATTSATASLSRAASVLSRRGTEGGLRIGRLGSARAPPQLQASHFDQFKLELSVDGRLQAILSREFLTLIGRWEGIDSEHGKHSASVTLRLFCKKIVEFIEANPTSRASSLARVVQFVRLDCVVDALKILYALCAKKRVRATKSMAAVEIEEACDEYKQIQTFLASCGAARMVLELIAGANAPETVRHAIDLGTELLAGGNDTVQSIFYHSFTDERCFVQIKALLQQAADSVKERQRNMKFASDVRPEKARRASDTNVVRPLDTPLVAAVVSGDMVIQFLTHLARGHFRPMQMVVLQQDALGHRHSHVNILQAVVEYMLMLVKDDLLLTRMRRADCESLAHCWACLVVYMQGPCEVNQDYLIHSALVDVFRKTLKVRVDAAADDDADGHLPDQNDAIILKRLNSLAIKAMTSVLEGRTSPDHVHARLRTGLELKALHVRLEVYDEYVAEKGNHMGDLAWANTFLEEGVDLCTLTKVVFDAPSALTMPPPKRTDFASDATFDGAMDAWRHAAKFAAACKFFAAMHYSVELWWGAPEPRLETVFFALPTHCHMLHELGPRKGRFLDTLDYKSNDRLKQFVRGAAILNEEMQHIEVLSTFPVYNLIRPYIPVFKYASFGLAIFLNVIILVSTNRTRLRDGEENNPEGLMWSLEIAGYIQTFLSFCVLLFILVISVPLVFRRRFNFMVKQKMVDYKREKATDVVLDPTLVDLDEIKQNVEERLARSRAWWLHLYVSYLPLLKVCVVVVLLQLTLMAAMPTLPFWLPFVVVGLPFLRNTREYLDASSSSPAFLYTSVYDICTDRYTAFYLGYLATSGAGSTVHPIFYIYHLLDIVVMSSTLQNVVASVLKPGRTLLLTCLLSLCGVYFFAMLIFFFLPQDMRSDTTSVDYCHTLMDCVVTFVHRGFKHTFGGSIGFFMTVTLDNPPNVSDRSQFWSRIVFDVVFYLFAVIMLNIIFGITIDTFSDLRTEASERDDRKRNQCFVCGLPRDAYDNHYIQLGIPNGFDKHIAEEHNMWNYLYFLVHVNSKELIECSGPEAYVKTLLLKEDLSWFPQGMAKCMAKAKKQSTKDDIRAIQQQLRALAVQSEAVVDFFHRKREKKAAQAAAMAARAV
ncbi:Aste57867_22165 [Aphanomyces stellatus]|uniref:Aste57867_22165 protein n=1 Tax=Aphanomyces stellatus TaxID=120398 RepID=A0A485LKA4_9STRA|nr:hypothetical protein As57867_022096 [Aphanomyces stellatus]VFT98832.1 Aste57867_22165 [Aphanomyces stellatus]